MNEPGITELRINVKAAINGINTLAKRLEAADQKVQEITTSLGQVQTVADEQTIKINSLAAKLYEAGIR